LVKIGVIYFSKTDVTAQLAKSVIKGALTRDNVDIVEHQINGVDIVEGRYINPEVLMALQACDAIVFGSPTYMGGVAAQFKAFADATSELWCDQHWAGKVAAGFTCGSAANGDQTSTLQYLVTLSNQHGMFWVGLDSAIGFNDKGVNRLGCQLGVVAQSTDGVANETDLASAQYLGQRVTELALRLQ